MKRHYYFKRSFFVFITMFIVFTAIAYSAEESITLTTYYPSPYGVYSEMRLYPKDDPTTPCQEGLMYYDQSDHRLMVCGQDPLTGGYVWQPISGLWSRDGTDLYPIDLSWNVGIGTSNPGTNKLSVAGTGRFTNTLYLDTQGTSSGQAIHAGRAITAGTGLTGGGQLTSDRTISLDTSLISGCTGATNDKIYWDGSRLTCGTDQTGGGPGNVTIGLLTVTGTGGSMSPNPWNPGTGDATLDIPGGPGGSVFSLTGGAGITLSGAGVSGNTWNPNTGTATINATGNGPGAVTHWFSPICSEKNGDKKMCLLGTPGQFSFCALAYHKENTGGDDDKASCEVDLLGAQWILNAKTWGDANVDCRAICF